MSNYNSIITQNNTDLSGNNTDLQDLLNTINTLPSAGGDLDAVLAEQAELIASIQTALEGKAGASVETCTVILKGVIGTCAVTICDNGVITPRVFDFLGTVLDVELTNVICNSVMHVKFTFANPLINIDEEIQILQILGADSRLFSMPTQPGRYNIEVTPQGSGSD